MGFASTAEPGQVVLAPSKRGLPGDAGLYQKRESQARPALGQPKRPPGRGGIAQDTRVRIRRVEARASIPVAKVLFALLICASLRDAPAQDLPRQETLPASKQPILLGGVSVMQSGSYPELRVDGKAFFVHGATFEYYRVPHDLWETSLERYAELGINTIVLSIPWNWHELREGELDFDGHTNPRRNLRGLLRLIAEKGFKLVARPGPTIGRTNGSAWRLGGYPEWLLVRPEYSMDESARRAGSYPPLAKLGESDAEAAARGWLETPQHMEAVRKWLAAVARELAPFAPERVLSVARPSKKDHAEVAEITGPLLWVQLEGAPGSRGRWAGMTSFRRYVGELRAALLSGGLDPLLTISPADLEEFAPDPSPPQVLLTGQWFLSPPMGAAITPLAPWVLTPQDEAQLARLAGGLRQQPQFPPIVGDFQAGWQAPEDDWRPLEVLPGNTLLASRLLVAYGATGIIYSPLQEGLTPAGWEVPGVNRYNRWDAALDLAGNRQPRSRGVERNAHLLKQFGTFLAASHTRADYGLLDLRSSVSAGASANDLEEMKRTLAQVQRVGALGGLEGAWLDPSQQPVEHLLRHAVLLLPAPPRDLAISETAQQAIIEYAHRGGTLIVFPSRPAGEVIATLWSGQAVQSQPADAPTERVVGQGRVVEWTKNFYSWVKLDEGDAQNRAQFEAAWAIGSLRAVLDRASVRPVVQRSGFALRVTQRVANEGTGTLGTRTVSCRQEAFCGQGLLSVANTSNETVEETFEVLSPRASAKGGGDGYVPLAMVVPAQESLLLPLHLPLCSAAPATTTCGDEVISAGAELLHVEREDKTLELTFYVPARATVRLRFEKMPARLRVDDANVQGQWTPAEQMLEVTLPRGASPHFRRVLRLRLPYTPHVSPKVDPAKHRRRDFSFTVTDAVRLPLGPDASLPTHPPLIILNGERSGQLLARADNFDEMGREVHLRLEGSVQGSERMLLEGSETLHERMQLNPSQQGNAAANGPLESGDGLLHSELEVRSRDERRIVPIVLASVGEEKPTRYQFDFDRDASPEWVLENERLRLILQPELGGSALALVDKSVGTNMITTVGALRDSIVLSTGAITPIRTYVMQEGEGMNGLLVRMRSVAQGTTGIAVEKAIRMVAANTVEVDYHMQIPTPTPLSDAHLEMLTSIPVQAGEDRGTRFCWAESEKTEPHCEGFQRGGAPVDVPPAVRRLEARTPGWPGFVVEWTRGTLHLEMKAFSASLRLRLPVALESQVVRYTILPPD